MIQLLFAEKFVSQDFTRAAPGLSATDSGPANTCGRTTQY